MKRLVFAFAAVAVLLAGSVVPSQAWQQGGGWNGGGWHGGGGSHGGGGWHGGGSWHGGGWRGGWHGGWRAPVFFAGPRFFVGVGPSFYYPGYYPGPYAYAPPVVVAAPTRAVYSQSPQYWYYCQNPAGYYPSVPQCPTQWLQMQPQ